MSDNLLIFLYDESGSPIGMQYRNGSYAADTFVTFFFEKNLQGDIIAIYNENGVKVLSYTYDAWGNHTTTWHYSIGTNMVAQYNPFRYRGYYYDTETGWYYLQSRYYNPAWGRFLNEDGLIYSHAGLIGYNMYAYCGNEPVLGYDPTGYDDLTYESNEDDGNPLNDLGSMQGCHGAGSGGNTLIYRNGGTNPSNLTPKAKDLVDSRGLSFSLHPTSNCAYTTMEALNNSGLLRAVQDGPSHVSVYPIGGTMADWVNAGSGSIWTQAVKASVAKWKGDFQ